MATIFKKHLHLECINYECKTTYNVFEIFNNTLIIIFLKEIAFMIFYFIPIGKKIKNSYDLLRIQQKIKQDLHTQMHMHVCIQTWKW